MTDIFVMPHMETSIVAVVMFLAFFFYFRRRRVGLTLRKHRQQDTEMTLQRRDIRVDMSWSDVLEALGMSRLPGDIMIQIIGRLPVKSIIRFKSVCKAWYDLFKNPRFIQYHTHFARSSLLVHTRSQEGICHILSLLLDGPCASPMTENLNPPSDLDLSQILVVGSVNGLVCLSLGHDGTSILLWNPATRELIQIRKPQLNADAEVDVSVGFAYDPKTETYKVIRVIHVKSRNHTSQTPRAKVEIFNSRTNSWRSTTVANFPWLCHQKTCSTLVDGVPYWNAIETRYYPAVPVMAWFDVQDEIFRFSDPHFCSSSSLFLRWCLGVWGHNPVAIFYSYPVEGHREGQMVIWKFNKTNDDWSNMMTIKLVLGFESAVGCGKNGEIIVRDRNGALFIVYDPQQPKHIVEVPCCGPRGFVQVSAYTETLISPSSLRATDLRQVRA